MGEHDARRRAAWRFVRAVIRSQWDGVIGAVLSGLLWQIAAVAAPLMVKYAIDHGVVAKDRHALLVGFGARRTADGLDRTHDRIRPHRDRRRDGAADDRLATRADRPDPAAVDQ